jgi:hypothetical protein
LLSKSKQSQAILFLYLQVLSEQKAQYSDRQILLEVWAQSRTVAIPIHTKKETKNMIRLFIIGLALVGGAILLMAFMPSAYHQGFIVQGHTVAYAWLGLSVIGILGYKAFKG